jgi:hypothetical protein
MQYKELQKVFVVFLSDTLSYPNAVMIKSAYAYIADPTMLTPCWLNYFTGGAFIFFQIKNLIKVFFEFF